MMRNLWNKLFLEERPSISLSLFRIVMAVTVGSYVIPTFCPLEDTYLSTALKTYNLSFFPVWFVEWVQLSPDWLVYMMVFAFCAAWFLFLIGLFSQISCILVLLGCYYFYALNDFAVGTLTWDILLVTLFLMCVTGYHGDYFSVDALRRGKPEAYQRRRPFFIQRLLQIEIAFIYFFTGLHKITGEGNWITGNPIHYLMNLPPEGVTKTFLIKDFMAAHPALCYWAGILIIVIELLMPFLLFNRRTRVSGIYLGIVFHITLILTLDVPAIFFFLFPGMLFLFINPEHVLRWIEAKRAFNRRAPRHTLVFDGDCGFCRRSVRHLQIMDLYGTTDMVAYQDVKNLSGLHADLDEEKAKQRVYLIEPDGEMHGGFFAFRRFCFLMPMMYPLVVIFFFPGSGIIGPWVYRWIAGHRSLLSFGRKGKACSLEK